MHKPTTLQLRNDVKAVCLYSEFPMFRQFYESVKKLPELATTLNILIEGLARVVYNQEQHPRDNLNNVFSLRNDVKAVCLYAEFPMFRQFYESVKKLPELATTLNILIEGLSRVVYNQGQQPRDDMDSIFPSND